MRAVRWSWTVARLVQDDAPPQPGVCASVSRRRNMDPEEEWNKDLSAHKLLDKKVICKQDGRSGKAIKLTPSSTRMSLLSLQQGDLSSAGTVRPLHSPLRTQNTLQIQSITRSECAGRSPPGLRIVCLSQHVFIPDGSHVIKDHFN